MTDPHSDDRVERFLVTGACGCIGAWTVHQLVRQGAHVVALDVSGDVRRLRLLLSDAELASLEHVRADITDLEMVEQTLDKYRITNVIHLAALQVPFCRVDPPLGARVNVVGTVNIFEAAARRRGRIAPVVYASSIAVYESPDDNTVSQQGAGGRAPNTLYGVYKRANEQTAAVYWHDHDLPSVGLRPHTVYGLGRDQGLTSAPTLAMLAAAVGHPFEIPYGGRLQVQYASDVADTFIRAARVAPQGATVHNLAGHGVHVSDIIAAIRLAAPDTAGRITFTDARLPFPDSVDASSLLDLLGTVDDTPLVDGVADTVDRFRRLLASGVLSPQTISTAASPE